jgi:2-polyprenyl-3-methyl-5-hydroxy-6-metoxy-1,4-benzoquinol methylase
VPFSDWAIGNTAHGRQATVQLFGGARSPITFSVLPGDAGGCVSEADPFARFAGLTYERFRALARDSSLSASERVGFPDAMREGYEDAILADLLAKLPALGRSGAKVLDIGIGAGALASRIVRHCAETGLALYAVDSPEMLALLDGPPRLVKIAGRFPDCLGKITAANREGFDAIIVYSVLQHVVLEANPHDFLDTALRLLRPQAHLLLGDLPNVSMLKRFLASVAGIAYHKKYMKTDGPPVIDWKAVERGRLDDATIVGLISRARAAGFNAWLLPQPASLPFHQRREDLLIQRP